MTHFDKAWVPQNSGKILGMPREQGAGIIRSTQACRSFLQFVGQEFAFLTSHLVQRKYSSGEMIFTEGDACTGLYVVQSGNVRIFKSSAGGREQVLSIDGPGNSIAELPVFDGGNYPASAQAVKRQHASLLQPPGFPGALPAASAGSAESIAGGWRAPAPAGRHHRRMSFTTVRHRLIALLVRLGKASAAAMAMRSR